MKLKALTLLALLLCCTCDAQTTAQEWQVKAVQKYPDLGVNGSAFNKQFINAYTERRKTDPAFFTNPQWPLLLANELAAQSAPQASPPAAASSQPAPAIPSPTPAAARSPAAATASDSHVEYEAPSIPPGAGLEAARFRWWAPADTQVRGVLVLLPGRGGDGRGMAGDAKWQALATQIQFGILGCMLQNPAKEPFTYQGDPNGLVSGLLNKAIEAELLQNGQKVKNPPLVLWGHSAGGNVSAQYLTHFANRVVAAIIVRAPGGPGNLVPAKGDVPILVCIGKKDKPEWVADSLGSYEKGHAAHAAWTLALHPNEGHEIGKIQPLAMVEITAAVALRLPASAFPGESVKLKPVSKQSGSWLGNPDTLEVAEYNEYKGQKKDAVWFLNEATAKAWQDYLHGS